MMSVDRPTGETIARLMSHLRPEWDYPGCVAAVKAVARKPAADVAMAAIRLAMTPEAKTPGALSVANGAHWRERLAAPEPRNPPRRGEDCRNHPGEWPESCRGCASDRLAGTETHANPRRTAVDTEALTAARAALAETRATLCGHGIPHNVCKEKHE
jgi:hypothetical protein